ncbi:MAG: type VI secretion system amidase immunity protein Tai4 [Alcaligenaceae bacterium]|nr:type VI secretion system amidase immunity protein Tai4 [Alcaligenaceae bacterium]
MKNQLKKIFSVRKCDFFTFFIASALSLLVTITPSHAANEDSITGPRAAERSYAQNFKDMALARCLAKAYEGDASILSDIASSHSALIEWTYFDLENAPEATISLVEEFLSRDYTNPLAEAEAPGLRFDFLKCLDLYHSAELDALTQAMVAEPNARIAP